MKAWHVALKDTLTRFRDRNGILLMLVAPLVLALVIGAAFGGLTGDGTASPISDIPIVIVNADDGELAQNFVDILNADDLAGILAPQAMDDLDAARRLAGLGEVRAVIYIPQGFSASLQAQPGQAAEVALFTDPGSTFSPIIVRSIVEQIVNGFNAAAVGGQVSVEQLLAQPGALGPALANLPAAVGQAIEGSMAGSQADPFEITASVVGNPETNNINPLAYFAPSMAIMFLMFTLFDASRSILEEEREGTLARMMSTPTRFSTLLLGKLSGVFTTGVLQLSILILASWLLFQLSWGSSLLGLVLMVMAVVAAAASLGAFVVAFSRDEQQAAIIGTALALIFAILGGNFILAQAYPAWLQPLSKLTINRWALDGFTDLTLRGMGVTGILPEVAVLLGMAVLFFGLALWRLRAVLCTDPQPMTAHSSELPPPETLTMKHIFYIALHYLSTTFRSRSTLIFALAMPLIFTVVLGSVINGGGSDIESFPIAIVNLDAGSLGDALAARLTTNPDLTVERLDRASAEDRVVEDDLVAVVVIPAQFSQAATAGETAQIEFVTSGTQARQAQSVESSVQAALSELAGILQAAGISVETAQQLDLFDGQTFDAAAYFEDALQRSQAVWAQAQPVVVTAEPVVAIGSANAIPDGFDQSSPGMLVTFGLVFMLGGATVIVQEREQGTLRRLLVMPLHKASILSGKLSGIFTGGVVQAAILIIAGVLFFNVNWGQSPLALVVMVLAFGFSIASMGMMIAGMARTFAQANALTNVIMYPVAALGGAWWPIEITPDWMQQLARLVPTYWAMQGFQDIITRGLGLPAILPEASILLGFGLLFLTIGVWRFRYE